MFKKRQPNKYIIGKYIFAEWRQIDGPEGWAFYKISDLHIIDFRTDAEENVRILMPIIDVQGRGEDA